MSSSATSAAAAVVESLFASLFVLPVSPQQKIWVTCPTQNERREHTCLYASGFRGTVTNDHQVSCVPFFFCSYVEPSSVTPCFASVDGNAFRMVQVGVHSRSEKIYSARAESSTDTLQQSHARIRLSRATMPLALRNFPESFHRIDSQIFLQ